MKRAKLAELPDVLTVAEVAQLLRLGRGSIYEAARRGELPCVRVGRRLLFPKDALARTLLLPATGGDKEDGRD
jgi:excisionase family DNA binding protein